MSTPSAQQGTPIVSVRPVTLPAPGRGDDLQVRVTAPVTGTDLPVVVFSHGFGWSMDGYAPLAQHWAEHGFVVVQPTHLDARVLAVPPDDPRTPRIWRIRVDDVIRCLDDLEHLEAAVPGLAGRVDRSRIAVAGHSWGGQTVGMLLGARVLDADGAPGEDLRDPRVRAGVLLSTTGRGGADLTPFAAEHFPFISPTFDQMTTPTLVVAGARDQSLLSTRGPDWFTDPYTLSPGPKSLLTVAGGEHGLGGIPGPGLAEVTDESPERVALVQQVTTGWLRQALNDDDTAWRAAQAELADGVSGRLESH
jgi:predicted dienelactone hydrolase